MKMEPLHKILMAGFAAVVITIIACTMVIDRKLTRIYGATGNDYVVRAIEDEGEKLRDLIKERKPPQMTQPGSGRYWFDP